MPRGTELSVGIFALARSVQTEANLVSSSVYVCSTPLPGSPEGSYMSKGSLVLTIFRTFGTSHEPEGGVIGIPYQAAKGGH